MIKIGRILLFFLCFFFRENLSLDISLTDLDHKVIKKVRALDPFIVLIKNDKSANLDYIDLEGLENFDVLRSGKNFDSKSNSYSYYFILKAKKTGKYKIKIKDPVSNKFFNSEIIVKEPRIKCTIIPDIESNADIFVGQKVGITVRFLYKEDKDLEFSQEIIPPHKENFNIQFNKNLKIYKKTIKDKIYQVIDIYGYICAEKPGEYLIENLLGKFFRKNVINKVNSLLSFFIKNITQEYWPNKPIKFNIKDLPDYAKNAEVIGIVTDFSISLEKYNLNKEEPILMDVIVKGNANFNNLNKLNLNIPDYINIFEPKLETINNNNEEIKKFQYVIQPLKAGNLEIPAQHFSYFDFRDKTLKKISTEPIKILVNEKIIESKVDSLNKKNLDKDLENNRSYEDEIEKIIEKNLKLKYIPWNIFFILLFFPLGFVLSNKKNRLLIIYKNYIKYKLFGFNSLNNAIKKISKLEKDKKSSKLYLTVKNGLLSFILKKDIEDIDRSFTDQEILDILNKNNVDKDIIEDYKDLNEDLLRYTNYGYIKSESDNSQIFEKAKNFLISLKNNKNFRKTKFVILMLLSFFNFIKADNDLENLERLYRARLNAPIYDRLKIDNAINHILGSENKFESKLNYITNLVPLLYWQILFILLWTLLSILLILNKYFVLKLITSILLIVSGLSMTLISYEVSKSIALIKQKDSKIYLGPDEKYPIKKELERLSLVNILKECKINSANWCYIKDGTEKGWIKKEDLKVI